MDKIKQLLLSNNEGDVLIGWELLNLPENKPQGEEWYPWMDILRANSIMSLRLSLIREIVGEDHRNNPLWIKWEPKNIVR